MPKKSWALQREELRQEYWPHECLWKGDEKETGWFKSPRTLPLLLTLIASKEISKNQDASAVYVELLSRHRGGGVIEMTSEKDHAFAAGYIGERAVRTWAERMKILEDAGFIRTKQVGNHRYKWVAVMHPAVVVDNLRKAGKVREAWWNAYIDRRIETKESVPEGF